MVNLISQSLPLGILIFNVAGVLLLIALLARRSVGKGISLWVGKHSLIFGFLLSLAAVLGSLFYSNVVGFEPCLLCWWQRIAIYPLLVLFTVAIWKKDRGVWKYALPLSVLGLVLSTYHSYVQWGGDPLIPCDVTASCSKLYVYAFGYITIPTMVLSLALTIILLYWANKFYTTNR